MTTPIVSVHQLFKSFPAKQSGDDPFVAVDHISFSLNKGEIVGLLGPNGAGKSTTIAMLLDVLTPTSGTISYFGKDLHTHRSQLLNKVTFASTYIKMPWRLTVWENLAVYATLYGLSPHTFQKRADHYLDFFGVGDQKHKTMNELSAGQITRVMLAKAFIPHPEIVLLDEPTASLDPDIAHQIRQFVKEQQAQFETTMLYTSHNMDEVADVCDRVLVLRQGKIIAHDTPEALATSVSTARMTLRMTDGLKRAAKLAKQQRIPCQVKEREIILELEEHQVAETLNFFASQGLTYDRIEIDKPTLEDYFLSISAASNNDSVSQKSV